MNKSNIQKAIFIILFFYVIVGESFSQISDEEARADLNRLYSINVEVWEFNSNIQLLKNKIKNNPDPYVAIIRDEIALPEDDSLTQTSIMKKYARRMGMLTFIENEEAMDILEQHYYESKKRLKRLDSEYDGAIQNSEPREKRMYLNKLASIMRGINYGIIQSFLHDEFNGIISDCLERLKNGEVGLQRLILSYLLKVAPKGDPAVISHLVPLYHDSSYSNSTLHENTLLGHIIETKEENLDDSDFISNLIFRIQEAYDKGWIDNHGIANSLTKKLEHAQKQLNKGKTKQAINQLNAFLHQVTAQEGKHLNKEAHDLLKYNAEYLIEKLEE
ncbi:MAG: hypothetical protein R6V04_04925 [bacterium]